MSNWLGFYILPFDYRVDPDASTKLPIDVNDFAKRLQEQSPNGEVTVIERDGSTVVRLYIKTEFDDEWIVAKLRLDKNTIIDISAWPKPLSVKLILWYRQYVSLKYPLFLVVSDTGDLIELTEHTSSKDVENQFPSNWVFKEIFPHN